MASGVVVGIDLGTTHSSVGVHRDGDVSLLPNALGELLTPSVVALDERTGALLVGRTAREIWSLHPDRGAAAFKRDMGLDRRWRIGGQSLSPVDLSALVLKSLKRDAETALGTEVTQAVITVPAYFDESQRFATVKAGELAGLSVARILNEPTAAAIAYGVHARTSDGILIVLDLGGGTFDVCIMDRFEGVLEVRSVAGDSRLGGEDFTRALVRHALAERGLAAEHVEASDLEAYVTLLRRCEIAKRRLSEVMAAPVTIPPIAGRLKEAVETVVTREAAEAAWAPLLDRLLGPIRRAFTDAGLHRRNVEDVLLVGGATRTPAVRRLAEEMFGKAPRGGVDPDYAVAIGAAIQGALQLDHSAVGDVVVTDVIAHSLGVEVSHRLEDRFVPGYFEPLIHRNTVIPTSRSSNFSPIDPRGTSIDLNVYEGEARRVEENRLIGTVKVRGIPLDPKRREVDVRFTYDLNGLLEVEATVIATGRKFVRLFTRDGKALSEEEMQFAARRLAALKEDPRDRPELRDLLARAEALLKEAPPDLRSELDDALLAFDAALLSREEARIRREAARLTEICEQIDEGERW